MVIEEVVRTEIRATALVINRLTPARFPAECTCRSPARTARSERGGDGSPAAGERTGERETDTVFFLLNTTTIRGFLDVTRFRTVRAHSTFYDASTPTVVGFFKKILFYCRRLGPILVCSGGMFVNFSVG